MISFAFYVSTILYLGCYLQVIDDLYLRLHSFGVTQVPVALATTTGSSRKSAAEALMSGLVAITLRASKDIFLDVLPMVVISPYASI